MTAILVRGSDNFTVPGGSRSGADFKAHESPLPGVFCWTKFGTEAGEDIESILHRKESERRLNDGLFFWGIGTSIRPSLIELLQITDEPEVLFSPMRSRPKPRDASPETVALWTSATGLNGLTYALPPEAMVTSRFSAGKRKHFALVCSSDRSLEREDAGLLDVADLRNLVTDSVVGSSQVTAVVRRVPTAARSGRTSYDIDFRASLVPPYLLTFGEVADVRSA